MLINKQPSEKPVQATSIEVHSIFDTIQGEGPFAGTPATFIRLAGCNLECRLCDTQYTNRRIVYTVSALLDELNKMPRRSVVVLTGGEPFRQNLRELVTALIQQNRSVQIETNGTLYQDWLSFEGYDRELLTVVCSPKTPRIPDRMWEQIDILKYVVEDGHVDVEDGLPLRSVGTQYGTPARPPEWWDGDIYVQPLDVKNRKENEKHRKAAVKSCMDFDYLLCLQIHKIVHLP